MVETSVKTLDLKEAADILKMTPEALRRIITKGEIPAAKIGKRWIFLKVSNRTYNDPPNRSINDPPRPTKNACQTVAIFS